MPLPLSPRQNKHHVRRVNPDDVVVLTEPFLGFNKGAAFIAKFVHLCDGGDFTRWNVHGHPLGDAAAPLVCLPQEHLNRRPNIGEVWVETINQGPRDCEVFAVNGIQFAYSYEMPKGATYIRIADANGRDVSRSPKALPKWALEEGLEVGVVRMCKGDCGKVLAAHDERCPLCRWQWVRARAGNATTPPV